MTCLPKSWPNWRRQQLTLAAAEAEAEVAEAEQVGAMAEVREEDEAMIMLAAIFLAPFLLMGI